MGFDDYDRRALQHAAAVARQAIGEVEPNPPVGAVLYQGEQILAEGCHTAFGEAHAEIEALAAAGTVPADASLAVTLEPCSSTGKQPPCTRGLIEAGVRRVVVGELDPDPRHQGRGLAELRAAGIALVQAPPGSIPADLIGEFRRHLSRDRPYVLLKWAQDLGGNWVPPAGKGAWISGPEARDQVHWLRGRVDGILVGSETVLADDPLLTARSGGPLRPKRVVLDSRGRLPRGSQLVATTEQAPVLWVTGEEVREDLPGVHALRLTDPHDLAGCVLPALKAAGVHRLLVEGGPTVASAFLEAEVVDRAWVFVAGCLNDDAGTNRGISAGGQIAPRVEAVRRIGCDAWFKLCWSRD